MATLIRISDLTKEQISSIAQNLTLVPVDKAAEERKKWRSATLVPGKTLTPVGFFLVSPDASLPAETLGDKAQDGSSSSSSAAPALILSDPYVRVPFRFACGLLGRIVNRDRDYPRVADPGSDRPKFHATLRDYQVELAQEAYVQLSTHSSTTLGLPPSWGKTVLGAWLWHTTATICFVYVNRQTLLDSWNKTFRTCFPQLVDRIWIVGETSMPADPAIIICMDTRYEKVPEALRDSVGCLIIDEAHLFCTPGKIKALLALRPKFVIVETATLKRTDGMENMMYCMAGTHGVHRISSKPYHVIKLETGILVPEEKNKFGNNFGKMTDKLCEDPVRNAMIVEIVKINPHRKFILLTRLAKHVELLQSLLSAAGVQTATLYRGQKSYSDSHVLLGTMPKIGTGFDEANFCPDYQGRPSDVVVFCGSVKEIESFEQMRGRGMRSEDPFLIYLVDKNASSKRHFKDTEEWILQTKGKIIPLHYAPGTVVLPDPNRNRVVEPPIAEPAKPTLRFVIQK